MQPPASLKALADPIYEAFYGLSDQPFSITTDPKFFYLSTSHQLAFTELLNGLRRREGMLLLTGETGTGKTTLSRAVLESLGQRTFAAMILNPYMSGAEVFRLVLRDFGLVSHEDLRRGVLASADVSQLLDTLEGFLRSLAALDSHAVIVLDEAQSLAPQVLDQIRILTSLEQNNRRLVQVILCGQPSLLETLKTEPMRALNERITRRVMLKPLETAEVVAYIKHRLMIAGGAKAVSFDDGAARLISELSHGLPRRINVLCDRALQEGRVEGAAVITADLVKRSARALAGAHEAVHVSVPDRAKTGGPSAFASAAAATPAAPSPVVPAGTPAAEPEPPGAQAPPAAPLIVPAAEARRPAVTAPAPPAATASAPASVERAPAKPEAVVPEAFPPEPETAPGLTFGQPVEEPRGKGRLIAGAIIVLALAGLAAYGWYAHRLTTGSAQPPVQSGPSLDRGTPFVPPEPPSPEDITTSPAAATPTAPPATAPAAPPAAGPAVSPIESPATPPASAPTPPASGQLPGNPNQVN